MKSLQKERVFGLDFLRAVAITLVVVSHATYVLFPETTHALITLTRLLGAIGVDLFFVLSGFLIGRILLKTILKDKIKLTDLMIFWKRRWLRTLPNYVLILLINILLCICLGNSLPEHIASFFLFLQNFSTPHPDFFTEAWSLSIEEFAYVLVPFFVYITLCFWRKVDRVKLFFWVSLVSIALLFVLKLQYYFTTEIFSYKEWSSTFRKVVVYRLDAIYMGFLMVCVVQFKQMLVKRFKTVFMYSGLLIFVILHLYVVWCNVLPQTHLWFYVFIYLTGVGVSLVLLMPYFLELNYIGKGSEIVTFISKISYSIYLVNYSIVLLTLKHFFEFSEQPFYSRIGLLFMFFGLTVLLSTLIYSLFELPILSYRNRKYPS